jgi:hypothetical protein
VLKPSLSRYSFLLADLEAVGLDLLVSQEVERDSSRSLREGVKQVCSVRAKTCHCQLVALCAVG